MNGRRGGRRHHHAVQRLVLGLDRGLRRRGEGLARQAGDPNFRLNFFVDEVGQFIGSNTKLMLNLQTIAESLNTKCAGRAWVFVTSQEDMEKVIGDRTKQQGNDFSKIQARFKTRVKLTSADVEEVIRKRLLEKNDAGEAALRSDLRGRSTPTSRRCSTSSTARRPTATTPTRPTSSGPTRSSATSSRCSRPRSRASRTTTPSRAATARSASGPCSASSSRSPRTSATSRSASLATFDHMFAGIRASLKAAAQRSIDVAERNLDNQLAVRLLKALFLVKYVESFQATPRNLTVLVYDRFGLDLPALSEQVKEALTLLESQTYVQRNGNAYEYLTNEEQVIEEEIKNVDIDASEVSSRLFKILSGDVIKTSKIRYAKNGQDFPFGFKLDDQVYGQQRELSVHFISPEYPYSPG